MVCACDKRALQQAVHGPAGIKRDFCKGQNEESSCHRKYEKTQFTIFWAEHPEVFFIDPEAKHRRRNDKRLRDYVRLERISQKY